MTMTTEKLAELQSRIDHAFEERLGVQRAITFAELQVLIALAERALQPEEGQSCEMTPEQMTAYAQSIADRASQLALPAGRDEDAMQNFENFEKLTRALEIIAVGDSKEPAQTAASVLADIGFWERVGALPEGPVPAPVDGVHWDQFPAYLIHKCEGETITEDGLQEMLAAMLKDPDYIRIAAERASQAPAVAQPVAGFVYQIAGALLEEGWKDWREEFSRDAPPQFMIDEGKIKDVTPVCSKIANQQASLAQPVADEREDGAQ